MARYLCQLCDNVVTYGENHPCFFYKNDDNVYSLPEYWKDSSRHLSQADQQKEREYPELINLSLFQNNEEVESLFSKGNWCRTSAESSDNAQTQNPCDISYFNLNSNVQVIEVGEMNENADVTVSSENVESRDRPKTDQRETYEKTIAVIGPSDVDLQKQRVLDVSDLMHATAEKECKIPLEENKWQTLNNDKNNFIYSLECVMNKFISDGNKVSGTANLIVNLDLPSGNKESKNGKQASEGGIDEHISLLMHCQVHSKKTKMANFLKEPISTKEDDNAVAGFSGMSPRKKKFPCNLCSKEFNYKWHLEIHYQIHPGYKLFKCNLCEKQFSHKSSRNRHYRTHISKKPYICNICGKECRQEAHLISHYRIHTGERPYVCIVCNKYFAQKGHLDEHVTIHTGEKPYNCPACEKSFTRNRNLKTHYKSKHE